MFNKTILTILVIAVIGVAITLGFRNSNTLDRSNQELSSVNSDITSIINTELVNMQNSESIDVELKDQFVQELGSLDVRWTEDELKQIIQIQWEKVIANPRAFEQGIVLNPYDNRIRDILGEERYIAYLENIDPVYKRMHDALDQPDSNITQSELDNAYREYVSYESLKSRIQSNGPSEELRQLHQAQNEVLVSVIGISAESSSYTVFVP